MNRFTTRRLKIDRPFFILIAVFIAIAGALGYGSPAHATGSGNANYTFYLFDSTFEWPGVYVISCNANSTSYTVGEWTVTNHSAGYNVPDGRTYPFQLGSSYYAYTDYTYPYDESRITLPTTASMGDPDDYFHSYWSYDDLVLESWQYPIWAHSTCDLLVYYPWYFTPGPSPIREVRVPTGSGDYRVD